MNPKYIDIHSHLNLKEFDEDRSEIIQKLKDDNIATITVGVNYESSLFAVSLAVEHYNLFASIGIHPSYSNTEDFDHDKMFDLASNNKVVAIGECGLDYFHDFSIELKEKQISLFKKHIELSIELKLPLMIHARASLGTMDAYEDVLHILESYKENNNIHANFHFFAGDKNIAKKIIEMGYTMSFDGPITFTNDYDEIIKMTPIELIMAETDSPYAAPEPYRGRRCEPQMVGEIVKKIAKIKEISLDEASSILIRNTKRIFDI